MDVKVIPNFLPEPIFDRLLQFIFEPKFPWHFSSFVTYPSSTAVPRTVHSAGAATHKLEGKEKNNNLFLLNHLVYEKDWYPEPSPHDQYIMNLLLADHLHYKDWETYYDVIGETMPEGQFLEIPNELIRIKINFFPNTTELYEHNYHIDYEYPHNGVIFSLNTCDGYTKIKEMDTKYPSVANTLLEFDTSKDHCSTTTTNAVGRFNININYL